MKEFIQSEILIPPGSRLNSENAFPFTSLPGELMETVKEHAKAYGTPAELWATAFLCGIAAAAGKRFKLIHGNYTNYPQLYMMIVGRSGDGKSAPGRVVFRRLQEIDAERYAKYTREYKEWKDGGNAGSRPRWEQSLINDTTPEALFAVLGYSPNGLTLYRDELSGWFSDFGRYSRSGEIGHYLSTFDNENISINRKLDRPILIREPLLNIYGTIQPGVLAKVTGESNFETSGFAQRFIYLFPEFPKKKYNKNAVTASTETYDALIDSIARHNGQVTLGLSEEAEDVYAGFYDEMEDMRGGADDFWSSVYAKAHIQALRLALTVKIARDSNKMICAELFEEEALHNVEAEDMRAGVGMMRYFIDSLKKFRSYQAISTTSKKELIHEIYMLNPEANQTEVARVLGVSQPYVSRIAGKLLQS